MADCYDAVSPEIFDVTVAESEKSGTGLFLLSFKSNGELEMVEYEYRPPVHKPLDRGRGG